MSEEFNQQTRDRLNKWVVGKMDTRNLSMRKLGEKTGIGQSHISRVLSGKMKAGLEFYLKIARAFDAIPEFLRVAGLLPDPEEEGVTFAEILAMAKQLTPEERQEVLNYSDYLLQKRKSEPHGEESNEESGGSEARGRILPTS